MRTPEPLIPDDIPEEKLPSLLVNWFLGSRARRYLSRRRFLTVTGLVPEADGARALDIGCGWGYNLFLLRAKGYRPVGLDIVQNDFFAAACIASANGYEADLAGGDMGAIPLGDSTVDAVTAVETMEHVFFPDRTRAVTEVSRVLRPGGVFVLSTPNYFSLVEAGKRFIVRFPFMKKFLPTMCYPVGDVSREDYHPYSYHRPSPEREIRRLLESSGFEITASRRIVFIWKSLPDPLFPLCRMAEPLLERIPLVNRLGSTLIVAARKM